MAVVVERIGRLLTISACQVPFLQRSIYNKLAGDLVDQVNFNVYTKSQRFFKPIATVDLESLIKRVYETISFSTYYIILPFLTPALSHSLP